VVDFAIESLFRKAGYQRPEHLLTHGFRRPAVGQTTLDVIPGVVSQFPNHNVRILKEAPWADVLGLLGQNGDEIMMRLLFDCGIFAPIDARKGIYFQLSGMYLSSAGSRNIIAHYIQDYRCQAFSELAICIQSTRTKIPIKSRMHKRVVL